MSKYQFSHDWFSHNIPVWEQLVQHLPGRKAFLEIGSFEGRSMVWIAENMVDKDGHIHCIDTWEGGEEHSAEDMAAIEARFNENSDIVNRSCGGFPRVGKLKGTSTFWLARFLDVPHPENEYDFIYIDGSHIAKDVLTDACMAWQLLKPQGLMVFDDYRWGAPRDILHRPKLAIDAFCNIFAEEAEIIHVGYQLVVRKKEQGK